MTESWRTGGLLVCVTASMAVEGAAPPGDVQLLVVNALLGTSLVLAFEIARTATALRILAGVLAVSGVVMALLRAYTDAIGEGEARVLSAALVAFGPPAIAVGVVRSLRAHGRVRLSAVLGVLSLYILIGMLFGFVYGAIDELGSGTFFSSDVPATVSQCLYFSFTTLTTVGYGDFTARTDLGHTLAVFEALVGQIYLVTVVALIVGNLGRAHPRQS